MTGSDLGRVARVGHAGWCVAERSRAWRECWHSAAGLDGFCPFDLMAASYVRDPAHLACAHMTAWVGVDPLLPWFGGSPALLVAQPAGLPASSTAAAQALCCDVVRVGVGKLIPWLEANCKGVSQWHRSKNSRWTRIGCN